MKVLEPKHLQDSGAPHNLISSLMMGIPFLCVLVLKAMTSDFGNAVPSLIFAGFLIHGLALCFYWRRFPKSGVKTLASRFFIASYWIFMLGLLLIEVIHAWDSPVNIGYSFAIAGVIALALNGFLVAIAWTKAQDGQHSLQGWIINLSGAFLVAGMLLIGPPMRNSSYNDVSLSAKALNTDHKSHAHPAKAERKLPDAATDIITRTQQLFLRVAADKEEHHGEDAKHWTYSGRTSPEHWAELNPDFAQCQNGQEQSPVDIPRHYKASGKVIELDYRPSALDIIDNGHTIQANFEKGSFAFINGKRYELKQMHYHAPSEHTVNGASYAAEWHFVHADKNGQLAVIGVLVEKGKRQPMLDMILNYLPEEKGESSKPKGVTLLASDLFPKKLRAWQYNGSLTTPPCTEGVLWSVLTEPMQMSTDQLEKLHGRYIENRRGTVRQLGKKNLAH